ncbi:MrcB family domain-containing protein [Cohaesibacter intestini]|uniref:MrcB family domain-containing protein n=1 Tax=Cohaesibacter intestini TaxID=2211145 RepID=UPI0013004BA0|nr:DUF3578 domain-containing protein [Cohaesibacter intestini]
MLGQLLSKLASEYENACLGDFSGAPIGRFVKDELTPEARSVVRYHNTDLLVKASIGQGTWATIPWLAIFDPIITTSATRGFYVVFLINPSDQKIFLSFNQGTTEIFDEFGIKTGEQILRRRAKDICDRLPEYSKKFSTHEISLGSSARLPRGYEAGHAFGKCYYVSRIEEREISDDLQLMLQAYETLIERGGTMPPDIMRSESGSENIEETRQYILSRRIERSSHVRKKVLECKEHICECCKFDPEKHLVNSGLKGHIPLDVHHSKPLKELHEGEKKHYKIPDDFLLLCPNCHRLIHQQSDPSDLDKLKSRIRFKYLL